MSKISLPTFQEIKTLAAKHYGDTAAVVCSLLILGYIWRFTSPVFSALVVLQHNVTYPVDNEPYLYTFGPSDPLHVLFIITIAFVLYDLGKEILERVSKSRMSKEEQRKFVFDGNYLFASIVFVIFGYYSIKHEGVLSNYASLWANYPFHTYHASTKLFYLVGIAYWLSLLFIRPLAKFSVAGLDKKAFAHIALLTGAYLTGFAPLGSLLLFVFYSGEVFAALNTLVVSFSKNQPAKKAAAVTRHKGTSIGEIIASLSNILRNIAAVAIVAIATHVLGLALSAAPGLDFAALNFNHVVVRIALLLGVSALALYPAATARS